MDRHLLTSRQGNQSPIRVSEGWSPIVGLLYKKDWHAHGYDKGKKYTAKPKSNPNLPSSLKRKNP